MTDLGGPASSAETSMPEARRVAGIDVYTWVARIAPAVLATLPILLLGAFLLPVLQDAHKWWSLSGVAVTTFAALAARRAGNRIQPSLLARWGGWPTTERLRYASSTSPQEVQRRHEQLRRVFGRGLELPSRQDESADPREADRVYADAMRRVIAMIRGNAEFSLLITENQLYGFSRNLLGLKRLGQACAAGTLLVSMGAILGARVVTPTTNVGGLLLPMFASLAMLVLWRLVDADFVRPSAEAYANRVIDALDRLPTATPPPNPGGVRDVSSA